LLARDHIAALADMGVSRASLGVQDFEPRVQEAIGLRQSIEQTARAADGLRKAGIIHINLDLMYGLPHQTVATVTDTAERALTLRPDRIALFGYAHVPWMKRHQKLLPEEALPGSKERFAQSRAAAEVFVGSGYQHIGLDHFARADDPLAERQRDCIAISGLHHRRNGESDRLRSFRHRLAPWRVCAEHPADGQLSRRDHGRPAGNCARMRGDG
jgi:oxygen-independent coproporphyrinogen-3 oxidase